MSNRVIYVEVDDDDDFDESEEKKQVEQQKKNQNDDDDDSRRKQKEEIMSKTAKTAAALVSLSSGSSVKNHTTCATTCATSRKVEKNAKDTIIDDVDDKDVIKVDMDEELKSFSFQEYKAMWEKIEKNDFGTTIQNWEHSSLVRQSNHNGAMYGRITFIGLSRIFQNKHILDLKPTDIFCDIGHGLGLPSIQAAYMVGCEARGIELDQIRFNLSLECKDAMKRQRELYRQKYIDYNDKKLVGKIDLRLGNLMDPTHFDFISGANKILVNNAQEIFAGRCSNQKSLDGKKILGKTGRTLDEYIAAHFARLKPGSIMVTCEPLTFLGRSTTEENEFRKKVGGVGKGKGLLSYDNPSASFFECYGKVDVGTHSTTWGGDRTHLYVWVYRRTSSVGFLCSNTKKIPRFYNSTCPGNDEPTHIIQDGNDLICDCCVFCDHPRTRAKPKRQKNKDDEGKKTIAVETKKNHTTSNTSARKLKRKREEA